MIACGGHPSSIPMRAMTLPQDLSSDSGLGKQWQTLVRSSPHSGFMQSLEWARMKRRQGYRTLHVGVTAVSESSDQDCRILGGAIFYFSENPSVANIVLAPEGPVLDWTNTNTATSVLRTIHGYIEQQASSLGLIGFRIEPRLAVEDSYQLLRNFRRGPADLVPSETLYLDLSLDDRDLLAGMHHKARYNIGLAERRGVSVEAASGPQCVTEFYPLMREVADRDGFFLEPVSFFSELCETLYAEHLGEVLLARHDNELIGVLITINFGRRCTYLYGGVSSFKRSLMAGYLLQWTAMKSGRAHGCTEYDFYGYEGLDDPNHPYASFSRFKRQFGGTRMRFCGARDSYFIDRLADAVIKAVWEAEPVSTLIQGASA